MRLGKIDLSNRGPFALFGGILMTWGFLGFMAGAGHYSFEFFVGPGSADPAALKIFAVGLVLFPAGVIIFVLDILFWPQ